MTDALFVADGDRLVPTDLSRGPWFEGALHGGPVAALLARATESLPAPGPMHPARLSVELLRPVGFAPLRIAARIVRPGRKVQIAEASLFDGDTEVARATLLRIRRAALPVPDSARREAEAPPPGPAGVPRVRPAWTRPARAYHQDATEHRVVRGAWGELGPCTDWIRMCVPLLPDEPLTALQRVAGVADFGNGISSVLPFGAWRFINPDLTIHLHRLPAGEHVCLDAVTHAGDEGVGLAECALWDERGRIGRSLQSLLLEKA